jgi:hypothetical protein
VAGCPHKSTAQNRCFPRSAGMPPRVKTWNLRLHGTWIWVFVCFTLIRTMFANPALWIDPKIVSMFTTASMESDGCAGLYSLKLFAIPTSHISHPLSHISYLISHIPYLISPISYLISHISYLISHISYLTSQIPAPPAPRPPGVVVGVVGVVNGR